MSKVKDGGPAFPRRAGKLNTEPQQDGMSLRDYFAAKALVGWMAADKHYDGIHKGDEAKLAADCYAIADAMLQEREK